jgi:hypothetical protein
MPSIIKLCCSHFIKNIIDEFNQIFKKNRNSANELNLVHIYSKKIFMQGFGRRYFMRYRTMNQLIEQELARAEEEGVNLQTVPFWLTLLLLKFLKLLLLLLLL